MYPLRSHRNHVLILSASRDEPESVRGEQVGRRLRAELEEQELQVSESAGGSSRSYPTLSEQADDCKIRVTSAPFESVNEPADDKGLRERVLGGPGQELSDAEVRAREARLQEVKRFKLEHEEAGEGSASASEDIDRVLDLKKEDLEVKSERCSAETEGESDLLSKQQQKQVLKP